MVSQDWTWKVPAPCLHSLAPASSASSKARPSSSVTVLRVNFGFGPTTQACSACIWQGPRHSQSVTKVTCNRHLPFLQWCATRPAIAASKSGSGRVYRGSWAHPGTVLMKNTDFGSQGKNVEDVNECRCLAFQTTHGRSPRAEEGNLHCEAGGSCKKRTHFCLLNLCLSERSSCPRAHRWWTARSRARMSSMTGHLVVFKESVKLQVARKHQRSGSKLPHGGRRAQLEA